MAPRPAKATAKAQAPIAGQGDSGQGGAGSSSHAGSRRRRIAIRLGSAGLGLAVGFTLLGMLWPESDRSLEAPKALTAADLAQAPNRSITVLVIGVDADRLNDLSNGAAPPGPANNDALLLIRVNPLGPVQVLSVPTSLAVRLPGQRQLQPLGSLYRLGGPALTADAVRELLGLDAQEPERYLVISRAGLRQLVDGLGGVDANPPTEMHYSDRSQKLVINLDGGLQQLNGHQIEQLARFQDPLRPEESRQENTQEVGRSLLREMAIPDQLGRIPALVRRLKGQVSTNLSEAESLSLLAQALANPEAAQYTSLPLEPPRPMAKPKGKTVGPPLRQLASDAPTPLWPIP